MGIGLKQCQTPEETELIFAMSIQEWAMYFNLETLVGHRVYDECLCVWFKKKILLCNLIRKKPSVIDMNLLVRFFRVFYDKKLET